MTEEATGLRKSKPVILGVGIIWVTIGIAAPEYGVRHEDLKKAITHDLEEYSSLMLFLFVARKIMGSGRTPLPATYLAG